MDCLRTEFSCFNIIIVRIRLYTVPQAGIEAYSFSTPFLVLSNPTDSQNIEKLFDSSPKAKQFACLVGTEKALFNKRAFSIVPLAGIEPTSTP